MRVEEPTRILIIYLLFTPSVGADSFRLIMGRRKKTDEKFAKPIRGPGRKAKKQGEPTFPKELLPAGMRRSMKAMIMMTF